ncbi:hypothetical protein DFP72DRAFT_863755 [Ephemerocybe angulata]|uniref:Uncharacterized protein n=1 Tax=Ephemerocybe angulata TaxID=980116 RepID=A0A8H6LSE0_9AGAR|nr:hypothetical protein DFP72DRAFT_863755 [Tulosesus angulatus]
MGRPPLYNTKEEKLAAARARSKEHYDRFRDDICTSRRQKYMEKKLENGQGIRKYKISKTEEQRKHDNCIKSQRSYQRNKSQPKAAPSNCPSGRSQDVPRDLRTRAHVTQMYDTKNLENPVYSAVESSIQSEGIVYTPLGHILLAAAEDGGGRNEERNTSDHSTTVIRGASSTIPASHPSSPTVYSPLGLYPASPSSIRSEGGVLGGRRSLPAVQGASSRYPRLHPPRPFGLYRPFGHDVVVRVPGAVQKDGRAKAPKGSSTEITAARHNLSMSEAHTAWLRTTYEEILGNMSLQSYLEGIASQFVHDSFVDRLISSLPRLKWLHTAAENHGVDIAKEMGAGVHLLDLNDLTERLRLTVEMIEDLEEVAKDGGWDFFIDRYNMAPSLRSSSRKSGLARQHPVPPVNSSQGADLVGSCTTVTAPRLAVLATLPVAPVSFNPPSDALVTPAVSPPSELDPAINSEAESSELDHKINPEAESRDSHPAVKLIFHGKRTLTFKTSEEFRAYIAIEAQGSKVEAKGEDRDVEWASAEPVIDAALNTQKPAGAEMKTGSRHPKSTASSSRGPGDVNDLTPSKSTTLGKRRERPADTVQADEASDGSGAEIELTGYYIPAKLVRNARQAKVAARRMAIEEVIDLTGPTGSSIVFTTGFGNP